MLSYLAKHARYCYVNIARTWVIVWVKCYDYWQALENIPRWQGGFNLDGLTKDCLKPMKTGLHYGPTVAIL